MSFTEVHLVSGTATEAVKVAPVALAMRSAGLLVPVLVAAGHQLGMIARAFTGFELAPDASVQGEMLADLIRRLDALWHERRPAAVLVQGDGTTGLAAALAAAWRRIPVAHLSAGLRRDDLETLPPPEVTATGDADANGRLIAQVAAMHLVPVPIAAMNLIDEGVPARSVLITGDTGYDAALAIAARRLPTSRVASPYHDGLAAPRAAQAVAALLGLADRPAPMPVPAHTCAPTIVRYGA